MNYTMTVQPYKNDFISVCPMCGKGVPQLYNVIYDERTEKIRYELMLSVDVQPNNRTVVEQNERPYTNERGDAKYFLITARDGEINVDYFAYGYNGRLSGLAKPVTEPLVLS